MVLPGKRGAIFLRRHLAEAFGKATWLPEIISAEDLIARLSGLRVPDEPELVCELYEAYTNVLSEKAEPFESFAKWGQLMLHDFNEIDRYLADSRQLYENLRNIKEIEHWSLGAEELTPQQLRYIEFMGNIGAIYRIFRGRMLERKMAWPGLAYRVAAEDADVTGFSAGYIRILFCGFNALSASEIRIIKKLRDANAAELLWDADRYYLDNPDQEAGAFLRSNFRLFPEKDPSFIGDNFQSKKKIRVVSVPKQLGQAQVVRQVLLELHGKGVTFDQVAVVLANEKLLWPVLSMLPKEVEHLNITMEYPLRYTDAYDLVDTILQIHYDYTRQQRNSKTIYHKSLTSLLRQPLFRRYMSQRGAVHPATYYVDQITSRNLAFLDTRVIKDLFGPDSDLLLGLLSEMKGAQILEKVRDLMGLLLENATALEHEHFSTLLRTLNRVKEVMGQYQHFSSIGAFRQLLLQVVGEATCPFLGEPLAGLQVMGVLETRTLDFRHVVLVNVNEGVLPSGRSVNSFIPNDLKRVAGLPLYAEKDAVYAYHFYRFLQRAETVTITYDSETDTFGKGEKSRFVTQLLVEMQRFNAGIEVSEEVGMQSADSSRTPQAIAVVKSPETLSEIFKKATSADKYGALSPSGLLTFKQCSLRFYLKYGAKIKEPEEVEETPEAGTFGSILHLTLEGLYKHFANEPLREGPLKERLGELDALVRHSFSEVTGRNEISGKSLLQIEAIKVYVKKLVMQEVEFIGKLATDNKHLKVLFLEQEWTAPLDTGAAAGTIFIRGKIDRIDEAGGTIRIIDYKSSVKSSDRFVFSDFDSLFHDPACDKMLQLLMYAWLLWKNKVAEPGRMRPCIIPFKVFGEPRFLLGTGNQPLRLTEKFLEDFETALSDFVRRIFDPEFPFVQTDDRKVCAFCAYNVVCNFHP